MFRLTATHAPISLASLQTVRLPPALGARALRRVGVFALAVLVAAVLLTGCGSDDPSASGTDSTSADTTTTITSTTTTTRSPGTTSPSAAAEWSADEQAVIDAYGAAMSAFDQATADPPNPEHPALLATTVDPVLTEVQNLASSWKGFGQALRYPAESVHRIDTIAVTVDGDAAVIETCNVDDGVLYEPATGRVLNDKVSTAHDRATMTLVDGTWMLTTREQVQKWEGVAGCAVASS